MTRRREFSADVLETMRMMVADGYTSRQIGEKVGLPRKVVWQAVKTYDLGPWAVTILRRLKLKRPMPRDFAEKAATLNRAQLCKHYQAGTQTVTGWYQTAGITLNGPVPRPLPEGYRGKTINMLGTAVEAHYGVSKWIRRQWDKQCGLDRSESAPRLRSASNFRRTKPSAPVNISEMGRRVALFQEPKRDCTRAGLAADYLRRFGPVVRCDATGRYREDGDHWRRGSTVLSPDEVIGRAERLGWRRAA